MTLEMEENLKKEEDEDALNQCRWNGFIGVDQKAPQIFAAFIRNPPGSRRRVGWLGVYRTPEEAARVYDQEAYRIYRSKALLNFPDLVVGTEPVAWTVEAYGRGPRLCDYDNNNNNNQTTIRTTQLS
ncbi:hypothetical protein QVD17_21843 [Tagetes erecta]|uniref:AP2/ERF domain-containing protein n=1 Tax=Tagetes erecta TaxID=13708 RepID=A0AAD8NT89_TARER|nr:hypothetical protein QVD17_21843 [Tagetes erecta]